MKHELGITLTKAYGVVQFKGTLQINCNHILVFEADDIRETMTELERFCQAAPYNVGYMIVLRPAE